MDSGALRATLDNAESASASVMAMNLEAAFATILQPETREAERPIYAVVPLSDVHTYFLGRNHDSCACLLVATSNPARPKQAPIRLEQLDVQFDLRCHVRFDEFEREGVFTVICCRSTDAQLTRYFLSVCETIMRVLGQSPTTAELSTVVHRFAAMFQRLRKPPSRSVSGLFGELYLIRRSRTPARTLRAWRTDDSARFDFADGDVRLDVKATAGRNRVHTFSYDQCNPPLHAIGVVASLFIERVASGTTLQALIDRIQDHLEGQGDLTLKLHEVVVATLGDSLTEALSWAFDERLAHSSLSFYDLREVPAIRDALPPGVSDVHFRCQHFE